MIIEISVKNCRSIRELAYGYQYKKWLRINKLKGTFSNACGYILSTNGEWNTWYNNWIETHKELLVEIYESPDAEIRVIRKTIKIYTIGYKQEEHIEMLGD